MSTSIAVIDDDPACRELLYDLLSEEGYAVQLFPDRATAAQGLRDLAPAAIILDVRLETPTAGWEILADLRHDPVLHATPVLVCSADLSALQERAGALEQQGCALLAKPFDVDELLVLLQHLARGAPPASPAATGAGRCAPVCAGDQQPSARQTRGHRDASRRAATAPLQNFTDAPSCAVRALLTSH
jgi:DNA-binding response OmpR family regulator